MADRRYALIGHTHPSGSASVAWGAITGTLADQTDLQSALDLKATTSSLNISNWDTAYGWGNHASAGYAASSHTHSGVYEPIFDPTTSYMQGSTVPNASTNADSIGTTWANHVSQWKSGAWDINGGTWMPDTNWWWCGTFAHSNNTSSYNYAGQIAFQNNTTPVVYVRTISGGTPGSWHRLLTINPTGWVALANSKEYLDASDSYLRLNQNNDFTSGVYTPYNLRVDGSIYVGASNYLTGSSGIKLNTPSGYAEIGPQNTSYCHYVTDRATNYFNKPIEVNGTISDYNAGSARPYLHLTNTGMTTGGNVTFSTSAASGGASGDIWFKYT